MMKVADFLAPILIPLFILALLLVLAGPAAASDGCSYPQWTQLPEKLTAPLTDLDGKVVENVVVSRKFKQNQINQVTGQITMECWITQPKGDLSAVFQNISSNFAGSQPQHLSYSTITKTGFIILEPPSDITKTAKTISFTMIAETQEGLRPKEQVKIALSDNSLSYRSTVNVFMRPIFSITGAFLTNFALFSDTHWTLTKNSNNTWHFQLRFRISGNNSRIVNVANKLQNNIPQRVEAEGLNIVENLSGLLQGTNTQMVKVE